VGSHQSRVEGQNDLPRPAGHTAFDAAQVQLPGRKDDLFVQVCEKIEMSRILLKGQSPARQNAEENRQLLTTLPKPQASDSS